MKEFRNKTCKIDGERIYLWENISEPMDFAARQALC